MQRDMDLVRELLLRIEAIPISNDDRRMLLATGFGHNSTGIAALMAKKPDAVRQKVTRLRARMALAC